MFANSLLKAKSNNSYAAKSRFPIVFLLIFLIQLILF